MNPHGFVTVTHWCKTFVAYPGARFPRACVRCGRAPECHEEAS